MDIEEEINLLIAELRTSGLRDKERILNFLEERNLPFEKVIQLFIKLHDNHLDEYDFTINSWIRDNLKKLIEGAPERFLSILESHARRGPDYISSILHDLHEIDTENLTKMYRLTTNSENEELRIASGFFLGEIGIRSWEFLLGEIA